VGLACAYAAVLGARHRELRPDLALIGRIALALALAFAAALALPVSSVPAAAIGTGVLTVSALALRVIPSELLHALRMR
jgi:hypothetical protein